MKKTFEVTILEMQLTCFQIIINSMRLYRPLVQIIFVQFYLQIHKVEKMLMSEFFVRGSEIKWDCPLVQIFYFALPLSFFF